MTPRDLAFWLQGFYELHDAQLESPRRDCADIIRKHAELVLVTNPGNEFAIAVRALADNGRGLRALVSAQFEHVIDKTMGDPKNDPAHPFTNSGPPIYRC